MATKISPLVEMSEETVRIDSLTVDPRNALKHDDKNVAAILYSLKTFGQTKRIVVDAVGKVLAGNGTLTAAESLGWTEVKIVRVPLEGKKARAYALADNRTAELARWDDTELRLQLQEMEDEAKDLGWSEEELAREIGEQSIEIEELVTSQVHDKFWISVTGPLPKQVEAIELLRKTLEGIEGVTVDIGTTLGTL
jgi:ParB-like chromosome segregation protein Spo0J